MADTGDVEAAIQAALIAAFYPSGTSQPSIITALVNVERGWPTEADIRGAVAGGAVLVRVHGMKNMSRDATRFERVWINQPDPAITLTATLVGNILTLAGTPAAGYFVGVISQGVGYSYAVQASDTLTTIAAALAALIPSATSSGAALTLPATGGVPAFTIQTSALSWVETGRVEQVFKVVVWAPTPALRDAAIGAAQSTLTYQYRLTLGDAASSIATLMSQQITGPDDSTSRAQMWRQDLGLSYDFPITYTQVVPAVTVTDLQVTPGNGSVKVYYSV